MKIDLKSAYEYFNGFLPDDYNNYRCISAEVGIHTNGDEPYLKFQVYAAGFGPNSFGEGLTPEEAIDSFLVKNPQLKSSEFITD